MLTTKEIVISVASGKFVASSEDRILGRNDDYNSLIDALEIAAQESNTLVRIYKSGEYPKFIIPIEGTPHLAAGEKISAIKAVREKYYLGLKEAKEKVDKFVYNNPDIYKQNPFPV